MFLTLSTYDQFDILATKALVRGMQLVLKNSYNLPSSCSRFIIAVIALSSPESIADK